MSINSIINKAIIDLTCDSNNNIRILKNNLANLWKRSSKEDKKFIIGIENGIAKVCYPNTIEYRMDAVSMGYDVISVTEEDAKELWKSNVLVAIEKIDQQELAQEIKQVNI